MPICVWSACEHVNTEGAVYTNMYVSLWACEHRGCPIYQHVCELVSMWTQRVPYIIIYQCVWACACMSMWTQRVRPYINITPLCMWACEHVNTLRGCPSYIANYVFELVCMQTLTWIMWLTVKKILFSMILIVLVYWAVIIDLDLWFF